MKKLTLLLSILCCLVVQKINSQSCNKSDLIIKTGINEDGSTVAIGNPLNYWKISSGPAGTGLYPRKIYAISTYFAWSSYPNTSWVNLNSTPDNIEQGLYNYQRCFCVDSADSFRLKLNILVDDIGYFNLREIKTGKVIKLGEATYGYHFKIDTTIKKNYPAAHDDCNIDTTLYFTKGKYCLNFEVADGGSVVTGMDVSGSIVSLSKKANAFLKDKCCSDPCSQDIDIEDSSYCENGQIKHILIAKPDGKRYSWNTGEQTQRLKVDVSGDYSCFVYNHEDNDSCWIHKKVTIDKSKGGHKLAASKDSICANCADESILTITPKTETRRWTRENIDVGFGSKYHATTSGLYCSKHIDSFGCIDTVCHRVKGRTCVKSYCDSLASSGMQSAIDQSMYGDQLQVIESNSISTNIVEIEYKLSLQFDNYQIQIYDFTGREIYTQSIEKSKSGILRIPISNFSSGIYIYTLLGDGIRLDAKKFGLDK